MRFSDNPTFKHLLDEKKQDILQRTSDGIQETTQFQRLLSLFAQCRRKVEERDFRLILIGKDNLINLCKDAEVKAEELFKSPVFLTNRTVYVDYNLTILNSNNDLFPANNNDARRFYANLSEEEGIIVFSISPNAAINYFIDGKDYGGGVFYTEEAQSSYEELKTIESLGEVLNDYRESLTHQDTYVKFFVGKAGLRALHSLMNSEEEEDAFVINHKQLLRNRPEEIFREDIRNYIKRHMKVVVSREVMLEDLDRLDIELTDENGKDLYFIEIKWVGESIHAEGNKLGTQYKAKPRINPDAVKQVLEYIDELFKENKNIKQGYLAVFDARKEDMPDTGTDISPDNYKEDIRKHFHRFVKLDDFRVKNINPR